MAELTSLSGVRALQTEGESTFFRTIVIASESGASNTPNFDEAIASLGGSSASSADV